MLPDFIVSAMLQNAFLAVFRRLPEMTAIILREFFFSGGWRTQHHSA